MVAEYFCPGTIRCVSDYLFCFSEIQVLTCILLYVFENASRIFVHSSFKVCCMHWLMSTIANVLISSTCNLQLHIHCFLWNLHIYISH